MKTNVKLPDVTFRTRVRDESVGGPNPYRWQDMTTADYFAGKRVILFSLPGAKPGNIQDVAVPAAPAETDSDIPQAAPAETAEVQAQVQAQAQAPATEAQAAAEVPVPAANPAEAQQLAPAETGKKKPFWKVW